MKIERNTKIKQKWEKGKDETRKEYKKMRENGKQRNEWKKTENNGKK